MTLNDKKFEKAVRYAINKIEGDIYGGDLQDVTKLNLTGLEIEEYFINLESLKLTDNKIKDISLMGGLVLVIDKLTGGVQ